MRPIPILLALLVLTVAGCTTGQLELDEALQTEGQAHAITQTPGALRRSPLVFGSYGTVGLDVGWSQNGRQALRFGLAEAGQAPGVEVDCTMTRDCQVMQIGSSKLTTDTSGFTCRLQPKDGSGVWQLELTNGEGGDLRHGGRTWQMTGEKKMVHAAWKSFEPLGYAFRAEDDRALAEISFLGKQGFWHRRDLDPATRRAFAAASAALYLIHSYDATGCR